MLLRLSVENSLFYLCKELLSVNKPVAMITSSPTNSREQTTLDWFVEYLTLKRHEYLWICRLGTLNKLNNKGLNKLIYDDIFHTNTDV